jgi:hypothetical protein
MYPIRNGLEKGDALLPLLFTSDLDYVSTRVTVNKEGFKLYGTYQLLVYGDGLNVLGGNIHTIKKNAESLVVAGKEIGLDINADKTKYMVMY